MARKTKDDAQLKRRRHLLVALDHEIDRQRLSVSTRASAGLTRASILIASAGVLLSIQAATASNGPFETVSMCLAGVALLLGVTVLIPRSGGENGIEDLQEELWNLRRDTATYRLLHRKLEILKADEKLLRRRALSASAGFAIFVLALFALIADLLSSAR